MTMPIEQRTTALPFELMVESTGRSRPVAALSWTGIVRLVPDGGPSKLPPARPLRMCSSATMRPTTSI